MQPSINTDVDWGFVTILDETEVKCIFGKEWYLPHHPMLNLNMPAEVMRVCNSVSKCRDLCPNNRLLAGPDQLHGVMGTIICFGEVPVDLTADIESMFLKVQFSEQDKKRLQVSLACKKLLTV